MPFKIRPLLQDWQLACFAVALFLYGLWGSPTPNNPNWVEAVIAVLLTVAVGWQNILRGFYAGVISRQEKWQLAGQAFLIVGCVLPLLIGVLKGAPLPVIFRDVIGFIFLCLPVFIVGFVQGRQGGAKAFLWLGLMVGVLFAVRVLIPSFLAFQSTTELLYLANSPLVLMSALYIGGMAGYLIYEKTTLKSFVKAALLLGLVSLPVMAMFVDLQRASFFVLVVSTFSLCTLGMMKAPVRMVAPLVVLVLGVALITPYALGIIEGVSLKTSQVGLNMRSQELQAVWANVSTSPWSIIFGQGWGASFASPAVGMLNVTYTHSLLSYIFFKMGLVGLILCLIYLLFIFEKVANIYCTSPVKGNALIWPFIIPILLYASHKSFDYGLLLSLILVSASAAGQRSRA